MADGGGVSTEPGLETWRQECMWQAECGNAREPNGAYCPQRHWAVSEDICDHLDHGISRAEARAAVPHPTVHKTQPPTTENDPGQNQQCC